MLAIATLICAVFVLIIQIIVHDLRGQLSPPPPNKSNVSLSSLLPDSLVYSWLDDSSKSAEWKVPNDQHSGNSLKGSKRTIIDPTIPSKFSTTNIYGYTNETKENFLQSLLSPSSVAVEPDWSVILGTFEHFADENWDGYLTNIGVPYLLRILIETISETVTISRMHKDVNKDSKRIGKKPLSTELGATPADYDLRIETSFWPFGYDSYVRLGEPILEHDIDGSNSLNTFFFAAPRLLIQNKIKDSRTTTIIRHFDEKGLNSTLIEIGRMAMATRFLKRVE